MVGTIAHVNLEANQLPYKYQIGEAILLKNKIVKTVANKISKIDNVIYNNIIKIIFIIIENI